MSVKRLSEGKPAEAGPERSLTLAQARELLRHSLAQAATLEGIAARTKFSKFHFARAFARTYGAPPMTYRTALRVEEAKRRLRLGAAIKVVAFELGFIDASHFGRVFKRWVGVPPGAYRKRVAYARDICLDA